MEVIKIVFDFLVAAMLINILNGAGELLWKLVEKLLDKLVELWYRR